MFRSTLLFCSFIFSLLYAEEKLIAGIAITVNGDPITLYEIAEMQKIQKITKEKAIDILISEKLKSQEIKRLKVNISEEKLDEEIQNMAYRNGTDLKGFYKALKSQGIKIKDYKKDLKNQIETQELMRNVLLSNANNSGEAEMKEYYDKHRDEFNMPKEVVVMRYSSSDSDLLKKAIKTPDTAVRGVERAQEKMSLEMMAPQIAQVFASTKIGEFTTILNAGNNTYVTFLIKEKKGVEKVSFQQAKNFIAQKLIEKRQDKILEDYFEKIKQKANIITIRN
ncbi:SurA N-terminal domain-containing protein [Helicobacter anatolicus]|uniref:SurA N-terminal domain-containing protein n=1 Tax=Helicobacter anatolicus TaxID=2905874 RepID=UPI001E62E9E0|nr:SurA N-terminal domain-containing protein [Helicobacter anatolicus]MCE3039601.1 SurA N-terminal domain-containing protein [Helicobacter anatolicus]